MELLIQQVPGNLEIWYKLPRDAALAGLGPHFEEQEPTPVWGSLSDCPFPLPALSASQAWMESSFAQSGISGRHWESRTWDTASALAQ